jgi:hypothetical protein
MDDTHKNRHAVSLGKLGDRARTRALTAERRKEISDLANAAKGQKSLQGQADDLCNRLGHPEQKEP